MSAFDDRPIYMISVAAELVGMHPQTLRIYETKGLVRPQRTPGGTRRYSEADVERLRIIGRLTSELGLNLAGVELVLRLEDELPAGPFDLVVSALAVHHLDATAKRDLFRRVAAVLRPGGRFVLADLVVPRPGEQGPIEVDWKMDVPDTAADQLAWLEEAGFAARAEHVRADLAILVADLPAAAVDEVPVIRREAATGP